MTALTSATRHESQRRVVLVDFDWQDADALPDLLQQPGLSIRLVAGEGHENPGIRLAELCGLPRTVDLADLTREIFDLALVSERSPRRTQIEGLLLALGTPSVSPQSFLADEGGNGDTTPAIEAPLALHAAAFEHAIGGADFEALVEQAVPDITPDAPTAPLPVKPAQPARMVIPTLDEFPSLEDRRGLEAALRVMVEGTGAGGAELYLAQGSDLAMVVQVGPNDALLSGLVRLALEQDRPQVVGSLTGPSEGKAWGAWPFRTAQRRGVLAAAAIDPAEGWTSWQRTVEELRVAWDARDRALAAPAFPLVPGAENGWLLAGDFAGRLELAVERQRRDGLAFTLHCIDFPPVPAALAQIAERLPGQVRDVDILCRPTEARVLLLSAMPRTAFEALRHRLATMWEEAWSTAGETSPAQAFTDETVTIDGEDDGTEFLRRARAWLGVD